MKEKKRVNNQKVESMISCGKEKKLLVAYEIAKSDMTVTSDVIMLTYHCSDLNVHPIVRKQQRNVPYLVVKGKHCYTRSMIVPM